MKPEDAGTARRGAADWLVLVGRFASLVYLNILVWLSLWVLIPTLFLGWRPMAIDSGSMGPSIDAGDVVLVEPFEGQPVKAGRVVTYEDPGEPGRLVTHRVTAVNDDGTLQTKGDANQDADSTPLRPEQLRGVGRLVVPRVGIPVVWLTQGQYGALTAWAVSVLFALFLLAPSRPTEQTASTKPRVPRRLFGRADTAASAGAPVGFADRPTPQSAAPPALPTINITPPSLPVPPGVAAPGGTGLIHPGPVLPGLLAPGPLSAAGPVLPAPPAVVYAVVPAVRYRVRLPVPPMPLDLPAPPRWSVSMVPPAPGTAPVAPIPPPPRPAAVRRGNALGTRDVPGWTGRLHSTLLVLALVCGLGLLGTASAPPASAAFSSVHHRIVNNTGNAFAAGQLTAPHSPSITAPIAACRLTVGWSSSSTTWRSGYRVYRSVNGGAYSLLTTTAYDAIGHIDNTANNPSNTYSYKMVAYRGVTWESPATTPVSASPTVTGCAG